MLSDWGIIANPGSSVCADAETLTAPFYSSLDEVGSFQRVAPRDVPAPYRELLDHDQHMTVTLEAYHAGPVSLEVLHRNVTGHHYTRNTLLHRHGDQAVAKLAFGTRRLTPPC